MTRYFSVPVFAWVRTSVDIANDQFVHGIFAFRLGFRLRTRSGPTFELSLIGGWALVMELRRYA